MENQPTPNVNHDTPERKLWQPSRREVIKATLAFGVGWVGNSIYKTLNNGSPVLYDHRQVAEHLSASRKVWKPAGEILDKDEKSCIDGREDQCVISTPGGSMGDSVMELSAVEQTTGRQFTDDELDGIFGRILDQHEGLFYLHSDRHTLMQIAGDLHVTPQEAEELIEDPGARREEVLRVLLRRIGCGHLLGIATSSANYPGARPGLLQGLMRAYWNRKWDNNRKLDHRILPGHHYEGAVLLVEGASDRDLELPLLQPQVRTEQGNSSLFIVHQPIEMLSEQEFLRNVSDITRIARSQIPMHELAGTLRSNRGAFLEASRQRLAPKHPIFRAQVDARRRIRLVA